MDQLQRDMGRVEAKVQIMSEDVKSMKGDLEEIKNTLLTARAVVDSDWKRLSLVATLAAIGTQLFNWFRPFIMGA